VEYSTGFLQFHSEELLLSQQSFILTHPVQQRPPEEAIIQDDDELRLTLRYSPIGVVGAICPRNYQLVLVVGKIGAALVTGNSVIAKPSPFTPYSTLKLVELGCDIFSPRVFQTINGGNDLGPLMVSHLGIGKISFTRSTSTGKKIVQAASKTLKNITLELGRNNATIICPDVDIGNVASQVALGAFSNSGQLCVASKRIFVHDDVYIPFLEAITAVVKAWKVGPAFEEGVMLGPVQNEIQYNNVRGFFEDCMQNDSWCEG
jgi:acyl-CoA reductase-like NAD-dependent aldehyde dehydrogenase